VRRNWAWRDILHLRRPADRFPCPRTGHGEQGAIRQDRQTPKVLELQFNNKVKATLVL